ncbi:N-formylglutamate amidohydrolase [Chelatococcus albus]|uniref:N-formylglutamate amidohydrolase n=1 Tax=Chelatococcus albus TaxID=3047466 RepID=UPI003BEF4582
MAGPSHPFIAQAEAIAVENAAGRGRLLLVCDHAVKDLPAVFGDLGLDADARASHIAWDPGALPVSRGIAAAMDAPLVFPRVSRLVIDCNRSPDAPDSIVTLSENTVIAANDGLGDEARLARVGAIYSPFHAAVDALIDTRLTRRLPTAVVAVHSFTPVYRGKARPWHVGILSNRDRRLADHLIAGLGAEADLVVGDNEPYSPADRVYHTLERHAEARGLPCVMIELRNDLIATPATQAAWARHLVRHLESGCAELFGPPA